MSHHKRVKSGYCLNCGKTLSPDDNFCPNCGQENDNKRQSFGHVLVHLLESLLHIDSKVLSTFKPLIFKPGFLTNEFLKGKRQRYLDPIRTFITLVITFFIVSSMVSKIDGSEEHENKIRTDSILSRVEQTKKDTTVKFGEIPVDFTYNEDDTLSLHIAKDDEGEFKKVSALVNRGVSEPDEIMDSLKVEKTFWNKFYYYQLSKMVDFDSVDFKHYLITKLPWIIFSLMPVYAFILSIFYRRSGFFYIDHLIFSCNLHSFIFLIGIIANIISLFLAGSEMNGILSLGVMVYALFALKNVYNQSWAKTLLKSVPIMITYFIFAFIVSMVILLILFFSY